MNPKKVLLSLAVAIGIGVWMVGSAGISMADEKDMGIYGPADSSVSADPENGLSHSDAWQTREPVDTGAVPEMSKDSSESGCCANGSEATQEYGGQIFRRGLDDGP